MAQCLNELIVRKETGGLNIEGDSDISAIFETNEKTIKSNSGDATMILLIKFREQVSVQSIQIDGVSAETNPINMKCYINKLDIDFSDINDIPCTQQFNLSKDMNKKIKVNIPKWKNLSELTIYFENEEAEQLNIKTVSFYGSSRTAFVNIGEMKKADNEDYVPIKPMEGSENIYDLKTGETIEGFLAKHPGKSVFVDFHATWCGPCKQLGPILCQKASQIGAIVLKIDVDKHQSIASNNGISSIPVVYLYKEGQKLDSMVGFNPQKLELMISKAR